MWHRDTKWANGIGKIVQIDLLHAGLPQTFSLKTTIAVKHNKMRDACVSVLKTKTDSASSTIACPVASILPGAQIIICAQQ